MDDRIVHLKFPDNGASSVDAYCEYKRIVGDDDGGRLFSQKEYEEYKKKKFPQRFLNRLYVSWTNSQDMDCKLIGPETPCFCGHRFKEHQSDFDLLPPTRPINLTCLTSKCPCVAYHYVPKSAGGEIRCVCKHEVSDHNFSKPYSCKRCNCCFEFRSQVRCGCGMVFDRHQTRVETGEERAARGKPIGQPTPYKSMGGLTGFSSLMDGYARLDPSGIGDIQPTHSNPQHPFLASLHVDDYDNDAKLRQVGESELDYYERRYQEKIKEEKAAKRTEVMKRTPKNKK